MRTQAGLLYNCERRHVARRAAGLEALSIDVRSGAVNGRSPLVLLLSSFVALSESEATLVESGLGEVRRHLPNGEIRPDDGPAAHAQTIVAGWACEAALLEDGRRQIVSLALPGDVLDLDEIRRRGLVATALTSVRTRDAGRLVETVSKLDPEQSALACAWRLRRDVADNRLVRHVIRLGRLPAYDRVVDLLIDLHERQRRAGLADAHSMSLPLTQEALADHLGLSIVHVNRTLQQLRRDRQIEYQNGRVTLPDPERLATLTGYPA